MFCHLDLILWHWIHTTLVDRLKYMSSPLPGVSYITRGQTVVGSATLGVWTLGMQLWCLRWWLISFEQESQLKICSSNCSSRNSYCHGLRSSLHISLDKFDFKSTTMSYNVPYQLTFQQATCLKINMIHFVMVCSLDHRHGCYGTTTLGSLCNGQKVNTRWLFPNSKFQIPCSKFQELHNTERSSK